jgi:thiol:disulfide interchange protein
MAELDGQLAAARQELDARTDELRNAQVGVRALRDVGMAADQARFAGLEAAVEQVRLRHRALADEHEALARASVLGLMPEDPHAHLHHRALPNVAPVRTRKRVLRIWSNISASLLLAGCAVIVLGVGGPLLPALAGLAVVILCTEAFARGHLLQFIAGLVAVAVAAAAIWLVALAAIGHWRVAAAVLFVLAALALLLVNIRDFFSKR